MLRNLIILLGLFVFTYSLVAWADEKAPQNKISYSAKDWVLKNIPASNNKDKTIYIFKGRVQVLTFAVKTIPGNMTKNYNMKLEFLFPAGTKFYELKTPRAEKYSCSSKTLDNGSETTVEFIQDKGILQDKNTRENEWKNIQVAVKLPEDAPEHCKLTVKMCVDTHYINTYTWPINAQRISKGSTLNSIRLGLWDYGVYRCVAAAPEIIKFYEEIGINYNQAPLGNGNFKKSPVLFGGNVHHGNFYNKNHPDIDYNGKVHKGSFCDPQAVIDKGVSVVDRGINVLVGNAEKYSGIATIDNEPTGNYGFSKKSIDVFLKYNHISPEQFERFRKEYCKVKNSIYKSKDPVIQNIFNKWTAFRSWQTQEFIGVIANEMKKKSPDSKFELTCRLSVGNDSISTRAIGNNNASMAKYLDAIMPQIYYGYGNASAKQAALQTRKWKTEIGYLNPACKLYPLLLIRYGGASVLNSPSRVRQQTFGAIAEGADGVVYYYTQQIDARYWKEIAGISNDLAPLEDFYRKGIRVDSLFKPVDMLLGNSQLNRWPGYLINVENPNWHYTAHQLGDEILLTLFNYSDNDFLFNFDTDKNLTIKRLSNCQKYESKSGKFTFLVPPQEVGFVILRQEHQSQKSE